MNCIATRGIIGYSGRCPPAINNSGVHYVKLSSEHWSRPIGECLVQNLGEMRNVMVIATSRRLQFQSKIEIQCSLRYCVSITDKYRVEEPRYLWYCGTKKYRKGDSTGTVEKWYRGAAVVPWYRATLKHSVQEHDADCTEVWRTEVSQWGLGTGTQWVWGQRTSIAKALENRCRLHTRCQRGGIEWMNDENLQCVQLSNKSNLRRVFGCEVTIERVVGWEFILS